MKKLLHVIATPRGEESWTLQVTEAFLEAFREEHQDWVIDELNLAQEELPELSMKQVSGKYVLLGGQDLFGGLKEAWQEILQHIERFLSADAYLISTPMWNFSIPYMLKHYIDIIVQPKYLFRYTATGVEGLAKNKRMAVITSRGGEYVSDEMKAYDYQESYIRMIFGFVGISDIRFVIAQPTDMGVEIRNLKIREARAEARELGLQFAKE